MTTRRRAIAIAVAISLTAGAASAQTPAPSAPSAPPAAPPAPAASAPPATPAEAPNPKVEEARDAFRIGSALAKQAQWLDALAAFERSAKLRPHAVTTYNIAFCERALGRYTRAKKSFRRALEAPANELPAALANEARGYLAEIEQRTARAVVSLTKPGAGIAVDGRPLEATGGTAAHPELVAGTRDPGPPEAVGAPSFLLLVDPGTHVIVVSVPGAPDAIVTRDFAPGGSMTLTLDPSRPDKPPGASGRRVGAAIAFGVGGASAVAGALFGAFAIKNKKDLDDLCPLKSACPKSAQGTIDAMNTFALVSTIGVAVAVAGAGVGTVLIATDTKTARPTSSLSPVIGPGYAGIRGSF
jgi:tetratricopeptide (TPR) repeat protein